MSYDNQLINEYTELLEGCHMGASTFKIYLDETYDMELRKLLIEAIDSFKKHEKILTEKILHLGTDPSDDVPLMGKVSEFFEKMKVKMADTDKTLDYALNAIDMGIKGVEKFTEKHPDLQYEVKQAIDDLLNDYKITYQKLSDYKIQRMP